MAMTSVDGAFLIVESCGVPGAVLFCFVLFCFFVVLGSELGGRLQTAILCLLRS
jgi:hypothetical protein